MKEMNEIATENAYHHLKQLNMTSEKAIILDLNDTIFETKSIDKKSVEPFFKFPETKLQNQFPFTTLQKILAELWNNTWDKVIEKYQN